MIVTTVGGEKLNCRGSGGRSKAKALVSSVMFGATRAIRARPSAPKIRPVI